MANRPLTELISNYLEANRGYVLEEDVISAITTLALFGDQIHEQGECTETDSKADRYCGARSLVEHALANAHRRK